MLRILLISFLFTLPFQLFSQFELPQVEIDKVVLTKVDNAITARSYFKDGALIYEMNYPHAGKIKMFCRKNYSAFDSLAVFYAPKMMEIRYLKDGRVWERSWEKGASVITMKMFHPNKKRFKVYSSKRTDRSDDPIACVNVTPFGLYSEYDTEGKLVISKNYDTGEIKPITKATQEKRAQLKTLLEKSNEIVIRSYGKDFFQQYIKVNYRGINVYDANSYTSSRNKAMPDVRANEGWFTLPAAAISYADFQYDIVLGDQSYPLVYVRVDATGKLVEDFTGSRNHRKPFTKGLLLTPVTRPLLSKAILLKNNNFPETTTANLSWHLATDTTIRGNLVYEIMANEFKKKVYGCTMSYFDKYVFDAFTGIVLETKEQVIGECAETDIYKKSEGKLHGFMSPFSNEPLIPYAYEWIQDNYNYYMIAKKGGKYGLINEKNKTLVPFEYESMQYLSFGKKKRYRQEYILIKKDGKYGLMDRDLKAIFPVQYDKIQVEGGEVIQAYEADQVVERFDLKTQKLK